jgi:hypothetical protein
MRIRFTRTTVAPLAVAVALATVLAVPAAGESVSSTTVNYSLTGSATVIPRGCLDCPFSDTATGTATCSACPVGKPSSGSFSLDLSTITTYPSKPCQIKSASGTLNIVWDTGQTSTVSFSGRFVDGKQILKLSGTFDVSSFTQWAYEHAGVPMNNYPNDVCQSVTRGVTAAMTITG